MTTKPEPNTRAGEALAADNFKQTGAWPDPSPEMLETVLFDTIWRTIKTWDVNVPHAYSGYMGATGNHVRAIYEAVAPMLTRPLPQPSELEADARTALIATAEAAATHLKRALAAEAQIAKLQADGDRLAGALKRSRTGWANVLELGLLPVQHQSTALELQEAATQSLTEWKDRA